ncbi:hypothetical protein TIFTF001_026393 [Ficus carica]|uniref:SOSEKI DIX-like domain-containing protein n=1 Tax=Ficus carica TaxID=3494 RepID=A0AA88DLB6_FICCA|nr:hypothetical protein TIFTF001_026393 [Ficus carica]
MAVSSEAKAEISVPRKWMDMKESNNVTSQRSKVWMEAKTVKKPEQKVPVIYYLSRNGHLEHPHFMVVPLSSPRGLYLKDMISRLSSLRGQGIANMYSWSSKSFVWQDLSEDDFIYPCQGHEYVLKGSQIVEPNSLSFRSFESTGSSFSSSSSSMFSRETNSPGEEYLSTAPPTRRKNQSCGSFDELREYQVYRPKTARELASVSTQTDDKARQRRSSFAEVAEPAEGNGAFGGVESLDGSVEVDRTAENARDCGRTKASTVLMQLIRCGSRIKADEPTKSKDLRGDI